MSNNGINTTYRVYVTTPGSNDFVSSVSGDVSNPSYLRTTTSFYQNAMGGLTADNINPLFFPMFPGLLLIAGLLLVSTKLQVKLKVLSLQLLLRVILGLLISKLVEILSQ